MSDVNVYVGRFGKETRLCSLQCDDYIPCKGEFIFYNVTAYKVLYVMHDLDDNEISIFVRQAVEEDY